MVRAARRQLRRGDVEDARPRPLGNQRDEPEEILVRIAEPHPAPDARLEVRRRAREVERHHALVGIPDVHHAIDVRVRSRHLQRREQLLPPLAQPAERGACRGGIEDAPQHRLHPRLRNRRRAGRIELRVRRVLRVREHEHDLALLSRDEIEHDVMRAARSAAVGDRVARLPLLDDDRTIPAAVRTEEPLSRGVESDDRLRTGEGGKVVAPLPVLRLVEDHAVDDLDLTDREVALEVRRVVRGVPQAELDRAEERQASRPGRGGSRRARAKPRPDLRSARRTSSRSRSRTGATRRVCSRGRARSRKRRASIASAATAATRTPPTARRAGTSARPPVSGGTLL